jgi:hypothetical protein
VRSDPTLEEARLLQEFLPKEFPGAPVFHFGTPGIRSAADDGPADKILKRKSKTSNLHGLEKLGFKGFDGTLAGDRALVIRAGRAQLPRLGGARAVGVGVFRAEEAQGFAAVLPGTAFSEKDGTIVNFEGREQKLKRAIIPPGQSKQLGEILMMWANRRAAGVA